jgi:hypothetical protein
VEWRSFFSDRNFSFFEHVMQVLPVGTFGVQGGQRFLLRGVDIALPKSDFLGRGDDLALAVLDGLNKTAGIQQ